MKCIDNGVLKMFIYVFVIVFVLDVFEVLMNVLFFVLMICEDVSYGVVMGNFIVVDVDLLFLGYFFEIIICGVFFCLIG